ncbi:hypothetical protein [Salinicola tamaricis]|uniref:capsular polysaccharide export protein, LipB/KpsS family n=1 Tax=Salinicola tamaricis TaxID=1771309 RepID=UPI0030F40C14
MTVWPFSRNMNNDPTVSSSSSLPGAAGGRVAGYLSRGLARWRVVGCLLPEYPQLKHVGPYSRRPLDAVVGWGLKPTAARARHLAARRDLPYVAIEDGFLRSLGLGVDHAQPHSLVVDFSGIYYDATRPSDLERWLNHAEFDAAELDRAARAMQRLRELRLSKYNHAPDRPLPRPSARACWWWIRPATTLRSLMAWPMRTPSRGCSSRHWPIIPRQRF